MIPQKDQDRFWAKVDKSFCGCWTWSGKIGKNGYASFRFRNKTTTAHRFSYQIFFGHVDTSKHVDHLCRVRHCVNPAHLDAVSVRENVVVRGLGLTAKNSRKKFCIRGHELSGDNLRIIGKSRRCVTCVNTEQRERWRRKNPGAKTRRLRGHIAEVVKNESN